MRKKNLNQVINEFIKTHGDTYDYSEVEYVNTHTKVKIGCPIHGIFEQSPKNHISGQGCMKCSYIKGGKSKRCSKDDVIKDFIKTHGDTYDYSEVEYVNTSTEVGIICPIHGKFFQRPHFHKRGHGCPKCGMDKTIASSKRTKTAFIDKAKNIHNDRKYDYSLVEYRGNDFKVKIGCPIHGIFEQTPRVHLRGCICPKCSNEKLSKQYRHTLQQVLEDFIKVHGYKYDYSLVEYVNSDTKVKIICNEHGVFEQRPIDHKKEQGCPKCGRTTSKAEIEILEFVKEYFPNAIGSDRTLIKPLELDIVIPEKKLAIEYNGMYWHCDDVLIDKNYHLKKQELVEEQGYRLIQIFENEWNSKKEIVKSVILNALGQTQTKIFARKCELVDLSSSEARKFLDENHLQGGSVGGSVRVGLTYNNELVSVMTYKNGELARFANKLNSVVVGGAEKLFKCILSRTTGDIISFSERRWFNGELYCKLGFEFQYHTKPNYFYFHRKDSNTLHSRVKFQKHKLKDQLEYFDSNLTEVENMKNNGYRRIFDSGNYKFIYKRK